MNSKKITFLTQYFPPEMGAPQSRIFEFCVALKTRGWSVLVVTSQPNYPYGKIFDGYKWIWFSNETLNGINVIRYPIFPSNSRKSLPRILSMLSFSFSSCLSILKIRKFKPDYLITESPPLTLGFAGLFLAYFSSTKHILNVSDIWPLSAFELGALSKGRVFQWLVHLECFLYKKSFACLGQSDEIVNHVKKNGSKHSILFRNGVDVTRFFPQVLVRGKIKKIVYMGLLGVAQGILTLCKELNFKELGYEFHIYGQGAERKDIALLVQLKGEEKNIFLHEPIEREQVPGILSSFDLTIIPLVKPIRGAVPSKIYEAMAAGLPILFAGGGEGAKIVRDLNTGWICEPSDFESIRLRLIEIEKLSVEELHSYRLRARTAAEHLFDRNIQVEKIENFLNQHLLS